MNLNRRRLCGAMFGAGLLPIPGNATSTEGAGITDKKCVSIRGLHFVLQKVTYESALRMLSLIKAANFNTLYLQLSDGVKLETSPWTPREDAWSNIQFRNWISEVESNGIELVPEVKLLTHQSHFLQNNFPSLMHDSHTYDPQKDKVYDIVFDVLDELIESVNPQSIHIGHDELHNRRITKKREVISEDPGMLPGDEFLGNIHKVKEYLDRRLIKTWIWGDMFLSPVEFPSMLSEVLGGGAPGYGKSLRDKLSRDVGICDWQYYNRRKNFTSYTTLLEEGFEVLGSTWKNHRNIADYSKFVSEKNGAGMLATSWFHVQRQEWEIVEDIISHSGQVYYKFFDDDRCSS